MQKSFLSAGKKADGGWGPISPRNWQIKVRLSLRPAPTTRPEMFPIVPAIWDPPWKTQPYHDLWHRSTKNRIVLFFVCHRYCFCHGFFLSDLTSFYDENLIIVSEESPTKRNYLWVHPMFHLHHVDVEQDNDVCNDIILVEFTSWGFTKLSSSGSCTRLFERYKRTQT